MTANIYLFNLKMNINLSIFFLVTYSLLAIYKYINTTKCSTKTVNNKIAILYERPAVSGIICLYDPVG